MFNAARIIWGVVMAIAVILIALIDQFIINFIVFAFILYLAFNEAKKLFHLENVSIIPLALAFILGTISENPLAFGIGLSCIQKSS